MLCASECVFRRNVRGEWYCMVLRQHRTIASAGFGGPFPPQIRYEKLEIHKVFLHFHNKFVMQNSSPNLLAELCGIALK